ncbi:MAG: CD225/dispanin family protein [Candidatus Azobacteroides sp.]|nr:CD225/dispanin family protein [Candidatus Azobacteroides sp.]
MKIIKVGRSSSNDIVISDDLKVSGTHCQIIKDDYGNYRLIDTNSLNGTYVNGVKIRNSEVRLNPSDVVCIGNTTLPWQTYFYSGGNSTERDRSNIVIHNNNMNDAGNYPPQTKPDSFLVWAILCTLFCCLPFGIVSIVYAAKVDGLWYSKDYTGAIEAARKARTWFWWGFGIGIFSILITTIFYVIWGAMLGLGAFH